MTNAKRGRGRPRREYHVRVRAERRATPDYRKLARALLEHAAMEEAAHRQTAPNLNTPNVDTSDTSTGVESETEVTP